jgi:hypothetical protein
MARASNSQCLTRILKRPSSLPLQRYFWPATKASQNNFVQLPAVMNMSDMCNHVEWIYDVRHPRNQKHYPFIPMRAGGCRLRNLALGGPFDPNISYRRECAGFICYGKRCNLCAEALHVDSRPFIKVWDVLWCVSCFKKYTLSKFLHDLTRFSPFYFLLICS